MLLFCPGAPSVGVQLMLTSPRAIKPNVPVTVILTVHSSGGNSTYRPSLKVIVQRFVQQCPLAAPLRAHQRNIDIVIRPCEPLAPCGNSHCVGGHGGQTIRRPKHPLRMKKSPAEQTVSNTESKASLALLLKFLPPMYTSHFSTQQCHQAKEGGAGPALVSQWYKCSPPWWCKQSQNIPPPLWRYVQREGVLDVKSFFWKQEAFIEVV